MRTSVKELITVVISREVSAVMGPHGLAVTFYTGHDVQRTILCTP